MVLQMQMPPISTPKRAVRPGCSWLFTSFPVGTPLVWWRRASAQCETGDRRLPLLWGRLRPSPWMLTGEMSFRFLAGAVPAFQVGVGAGNAPRTYGVPSCEQVLRRRADHMAPPPAIDGGGGPPFPIEVRRSRRTGGETAASRQAVGAFRLAAGFLVHAIAAMGGRTGGKRKGATGIRLGSRQTSQQRNNRQGGEKRKGGQMEWEGGRSMERLECAEGWGIEAMGGKKN